MKIVAVVAQKGGVGKTTVSQCLAVEALRQGIPTAMIDADPQRSAAEWGEQRQASDIDAPDVIPLGSKSLATVVADLKKRGAAFVVIDTPPHSAPAINAALARIIHEKCAVKAKPLISFTTMRMGCLMKFFAMKSLAQVFGGLGRFRAVR